MSKPTKVIKEIELDSCILSLHSDDILHIAIKPNVTLSLKDGESIVKGFREIGGGRKFLLLFIAGLDTSATTEARYYASSPEANQYTIASAFVVTSIPQKVLGNAYITFNKPGTPTKIFTDYDDAVKWLYSFKK
jgi:hypothetical protein